MFQHSMQQSSHKAALFFLPCIIKFFHAHERNVNNLIEITEILTKN